MNDLQALTLFFAALVRLRKTVREMRNKQREYFRTRNQSTLTEAKQAEREVDAILDEIDNIDKPKQETFL